VTTRAPGRHRAPTTSRSRLTRLSDTVAAGASTYRRRSAVLAASSGLLVTMGLPAVASPVTDAPERATTAPVAAPGTAPATASVTATGSVRVPAQATVDFALGALTTVDTAEAERAAAQRAAEEAARAERAEAAARASRDLPGSRADADDEDGDDDADGDDDGDDARAGDGEDAVDDAVAALASGSAAIEVGSRYIGTPYRYGGTSPDGFDCSGFVQYVYDKLGVALPRTAEEQASAGTRVSAREARPGDIVSFTGAGGVYHNGIYAGDGKMLDAPRTGKAIAVRDVWSSVVTFTRVG
jgi:cell wall-associated NlpC family hydrolase